MPRSLLMFSVSSWCQPPVRSWSSWQCLSSRSTGVPAKLSMMAGNWRKSPSNRNLILRFMETQAMSFHSPVSSCVISSATSQSMLQYPFRTVLRAQWSAVSAYMPKFCTEEWVFVMILTLYPSSRRAVTIWRAR